MRRPPVKSAARVLEVFEYFKEKARPLALKELTDGLGYPQSSTTVLLKSLVTLGYLNYDRKSRTYIPSLRIAALGTWISEQLVPRPEVLELMRDLREATGETIALAAQNDLFVQYLKLIDSEHVIRFHIPEGSMRPLTQSSFGLLFLSRMTNAVAEKTIRHINANEPEPKLRRNIPEIMREVEEVRRLGYCLIPNKPMEGAGTVSTLLPLDLYGRPLAIGVGGYILRIEPKKHQILSYMRAAIVRHLERPSGREKRKRHI